VGESLAFAVVVAAAAWALDRRGIPLPGLDLVLRRIGLQAALDRRRPVPPPAVRDVERAGTRL
jgi:hypothetical protein